MTAAATASAKTRKRPDRRAVREGGATGGGEPLKVRGATMADGRIKSPLGTSRTRRPTAMGNMGSRVEPGCPPPTPSLAARWRPQPPPAHARLAPMHAPHAASQDRGAALQRRRGALQERAVRGSGGKVEASAPGAVMDAGRVVAGAGRVRARVAHCQSPVHTSRDRARPRPRPAADAPGDVATSLFTSPARPRWQIDQTDTRTLLHYAVMLRDKMAPQKVRASTGGDVTGNSGAQAALMLCAWLWLW